MPDHHRQVKTRDSPPEHGGSCSRSSTGHTPRRRNTLR
ncbi:hypothetical protein I551_1912 [Mycobacterium ulcerans str. Harvey]|uniref:Uncharacterized protein n=1 Tax=Mycobacterium ulcerans str. Harvey TaxID=1299332 RepID=A0ABN0R312_MYCUL|nr:hypothetical protein I551_1912 [Mycobacterium ulcerans str. Harvey]